MSLPLLVVLVVVGISLSVAAVHFTGGSKLATLGDAQAALNRFAEDFPDEKVLSVRLTRDGRSAFLGLGGDRTGIVHSVGDRYLTRIVTPNDIAVIEAGETDRLGIRFHDFTWKGGQFDFRDAADARSVRAALSRREMSGERRAAG